MLASHPPLRLSSGKTERLPPLSLCSRSDTAVWLRDWAQQDGCWATLRPDVQLRISDAAEGDVSPPCAAESAETHALRSTLRLLLLRGRSVGGVSEVITCVAPFPRSAWTLRPPHDCCPHCRSS